ncbi:exodeoxyribonuclease III [Coraliomargarita parva]|uniref:exodeoxyribonuclease III n=1 Tax=Coraliomargarita parva TaxID=3014050 RepID=UPI0022B381BE|nr:exodeoxyribonuclease III [Coraliomargarita parva]
MTPRKLLSWNVNGLRAVLKKGFDAFLSESQPDLICLQETKISSDLCDDFAFAGYPHVYWNCAEKKGYSGTALISRTQPRSVSYGIGAAEHDGEGRVITADFGAYYLVTVYTPNAQNHDENGRPRRLDYRTLEWDVAFLDHVKSLESEKPVIFCGDLNVAHREIDLANPKTNRKNAGFTDEERAGFDQIMAAGFVDSFRHLYPDLKDRYSWWSYRAAARARNVGWRIDYFCLSQSLADKIEDATILDSVMGSDHCPVGLELKAL